MRRTVCIITICFMVMSLFSGCTILQKLGLQKSDEDELHPVSSVVMGEEEAKKLNENMPIYLYFANENNTKLVKEIRYVPMTEAKKSVNNLASIIVDELIKGPGTESSLKRTIPVGAKQKAKVKIDSSTRIATVDLSKEFKDKHPGGKAEERMTIYSIVNSLTELKEIQKVKFLVEGKSSKEFKGNFQFDVPFPRTVSLISKEAPDPAINNDSKDNSKQDKGKQDVKKKDDKKQDSKSTSNTDEGLDSGDMDVSSEYDEEDVDVSSEYDEEGIDVSSEYDEEDVDVSSDIGETEGEFEEVGEILE